MLILTSPYIDKISMKTGLPQGGNLLLNLDQLGRFEWNHKDNVYIEETNDNDIAIIGVSAKLPMADNVEEFWDLLSNGKDLIRDLPYSRRKDIEAYQTIKSDHVEENYPIAAYLDSIDTFDYSFFRMSPRQAALMDPHHRIFLEMTWKAIEDAGYGGNKLVGKNVGVFAGFNPRLEYKKIIEEVDPASLSDSLIGNLPSVLASLISHYMDFKGPNMVINTACSSSLVAVHVALQSLRNKECTVALVGGIRLSILPHEDIRSSDIGIVSSNGRAMVFDDDSDGSGGGEGCVVMLLKPLSTAIEDKDNIYAVIKGSAINNDGTSASISTPNAKAQEEVIDKAWSDAGVDPETIDYIEAHGTGTKLGDPIEVKGIKDAFSRYTRKKQFCAVGSVKTNMGHLDTAAGIAGLLKAVLSLKHQQIPASLYFKTPNRNIDFEDSPLYVNRALIPWESIGPRRCGITSLGLSGTNAHVILEEAPSFWNDQETQYSSLRVLAISSLTEKSLKILVSKYRSFLERNELVNIDDLCFTTNTGRGHYSHRLALIFEDITDLEKKLKQLESIEWYQIKDEEIHYKTINDQALEYQKDRSEWTDQRVMELIKIGFHRETLIEICRMYTEGCDLNWDLLYKGQRRRRISLPTYSFEAQRCWIQNDDLNGVTLETKERVSAKKQHKIPILKKMQHVTVLGKIEELYSEQELVIANVWGKLLGYDSINIYDDYYRLGGDSIQALRIVNMLNEMLDTNLEVSDLLKNPTVDKLAQSLAEKSKKLFKP
ncbi:beta-ketoacyl synthase N-terminal-like domain-containing protein, partial [Paenibacillus plantarum]|uniref:beta-ketoacyl synthase N-terminal-like domain-containing protein n=1 Tax=Paenibacillus plantarum TaxID=2654975 RepID=UPI0028ACA8E0